MILKLFKSSKYGLPIISIILFITCSIVTIPTYFQNELWYVFSIQSKPFFFWQVFSGIFEHSIFPDWFLWVHFLGNMSIALILGVLIERIVGSNKMLFLTLLAASTHVLFFQLRFRGQFVSGSGASGIVYAYAPVALYILMKFVKSSRYNYKKDVMFYILSVEFIFIWVFITAMSSWNETNVYHLVATIVGVLFWLRFKKQIDLEISYILLASNTVQPVLKSKWSYLTMVLPLFMLVIIFFYSKGALDSMFIEPINLSAHDTIKDVVDNNDLVKINFSEPISNFNSVYTSGIDSSTITYSEDRMSVYCKFTEGIKHPYEIILRSAYSLDGRVVRDIRINIK